MRDSQSVGVPPRSASLMPVLILFHRAFDLAHTEPVSLKRLEFAAQALALADAIRHLVDDAGDESMAERWSIKTSETAHLLDTIRDALLHNQEEYT
ncbi:MAG: hypothetical protein U0172_00785 [Nitrospiraceae bacterium]